MISIGARAPAWPVLHLRKLAQQGDVEAVTSFPIFGDFLCFFDYLGFMLFVDGEQVLHQKLVCAKIVYEFV